MEQVARDAIRRAQDYPYPGPDCLTPATVEQYAFGADLSDKQAIHVKDCEICRALLVAVTKDPLTDLDESVEAVIWYAKGHAYAAVWPDEPSGKDPTEPKPIWEQSDATGDTTLTEGSRLSAYRAEAASMIREDGRIWDTGDFAAVLVGGRSQE
jgi:hypothetical protein